MPKSVYVETTIAGAYFDERDDVVSRFQRHQTRLCGDAINAVLAAAGSNLPKLLGLLRRGRRRLFFALCDSLVRHIFPLIRRIRSLPKPCDATLVPVR